MQAKKLKITLSIVLAGLIGSIIYYGENTKSAAALSLDGHAADRSSGDSWVDRCTCRRSYFLNGNNGAIE